MMHVQVDDRDAPHARTLCAATPPPVRCQRVEGGDGDGVEDAEAAGDGVVQQTAHPGVVPRRPHDAERAAVGPRHDAVDRRARGTARAQRGGERAAREGRVAVR